MKISLLLGVNLGRLGLRKAQFYGQDDGKSYWIQLEKEAKELGVSSFARFQSDVESDFIHEIHRAQDEKTSGLIVNAAAWSHTSLAISDALLDASIPFVEVHLSNTKARESFRHHSYLSSHALGIIEGFGLQGYSLALNALCHHLAAK